MSEEDSMHSVFLISEKEAMLKQKEKTLAERQRQIEIKADQISLILKSFSKNDIENVDQQNQSENNKCSDLPLQVPQESIVLASKISFGGYKQDSQSSDDSASQKVNLKLDTNLEQDEDISQAKKYESPKFFLGSGSPLKDD